MSKRKSKKQKKKFFAHPKNRKRVFVKKPIQEYDKQLRKRGLFSIQPTEDFAEVPECSHGPCLLFKKQLGESSSERYFACAVYRSDERNCDFRVDINENNEVIEKEEEPYKKRRRLEKESQQKDEKWNYGCIPKKLKLFQDDSLLLYCRKCNDVFEKKHACVCEPTERSSFRTPSRLLQPIDNQSGEAQFFFSDESLGVILSTINDSGVDGVICMGAPRVFETMKAAKTAHKLFMLDYDRRYAHFYPSKQYAQYSMLVDHFFDPKAKDKLADFFENCEKVLMIVDPPFGAFIEPLMKSIDKMKQRCLSKKPSASFYTQILLPIFVGKHVLRSCDTFWMSDYRVTYENHKIYASPQKTVVRIFTDLPSKALDLSDVKGYKFCEMCERYVTKKNVHCFQCASCTSLSGGPYHHCERCSRCVKPSYKHCRKCNRCHPPDANRCHAPEDHE